LSPSQKITAPASVLFATPECAPLVKTGGLGDVSAALPAALHALGHDVRVLLPGYPAVRDAAAKAPELAHFNVVGHKVRLLDSHLPSGVPLIVVDSPELFARSGGPYQQDDGTDWKDNALRFGVLSCVAAILGSDVSPLAWRPDVVHCNDWPTALAPLYLRFGTGARAASLITIHNLAFQGVFPYEDIEPLELPPESRGTAGVEFYGKASFLKGGLVYADVINTVSPTYAREIQTPELGFGLDGVLRHRARDLHGILNGIDTATWNPETDPWIPSRYGAATLEKKAANKRALKERLGLDGPDDLPLAGAVSRLAHQKGIDLIADAIPQIAALPAQVIVVGSGERALVEQLRAMQLRYPQHLATFIGFDEGVAHLVEAGADLFLMPSRFEPCGMNQMYSQRYGTPPVANATGGLVDTIVDESRASPDTATGFLMREATVPALMEGVERAVDAYRAGARWTRLQRNGMAKDFGWDFAARAYAALYASIRSTS
jgi:starch synthase